MTNSQRRRQLVQLVTVLNVTTLAIALVQHPKFFFIQPFSAYTWWLSAEQLLFSVGWAAFLIVPLFHAFNFEKLVLPEWLVVAGFTLWPLSLVLIHLSLWIATGNPYLEYLSKYPIFILTDVVAPLAYLAVHRFKGFKPS